MENCVFCKVIQGDFNTKFVYQDNDIVVFPDIRPKAKIHLLVVPREHIREILTVENIALFGKVFEVIQKVAKEQNLEGKGFRVVVNAGGAQEVDHLHIHVLGPLGKAAAM